MTKSFLAHLALLLALLTLCGPVYAQRATLSGVVSDQKGGVVSGAGITLVNVDQGLKRETTTNESGYFTVPFLQPGRYVVTAQKDGFSVAEITDLILHVGDVRGLNIRLEVGAAPVEIEVSGNVQSVETVSSALGSVVTGDVIRNAPLNGRSILDLPVLQAGVTTVNLDSRAVGNFTVAGNRSDSVSYLLDGGLNNDLIDNHPVFIPNPDTVSEFQILTSNYPAEYGRNAGGIVTVATQSGTNTWHGSLFEYLRNNALDANSFFNKNFGLPRAILKRNQFGGTLGGPLTIPKAVKGRDRFFFFVGYQGERQTQDISSNSVTTFTQSELGGDFSHSGSGGGPDQTVATFLQTYPFFQSDPVKQAQAIIDPARINSVAQNYINARLIPTSPTGLLSSQQPVTFNRDELTTKFDFDVNAHNKLTLTLGWDRVDQLTPFDYANVPGFPDVANFHDYFLNLAYTHLFSARLLNELKVTLQRSSHVAENPARQLPTPAQLGINITPDLATGPTNLAFFDKNLGVGFSTQGPQTFADNTFAYSDSLSWTHGPHSWKFGGGFSAYQSNTLFAFAPVGEFGFFGNASSSGNSFADFLLGLPVQYIQFSAAASNIRSKFTYGFVQDDWRVNKRLVITLGARYEYSTPKLDTQGRTFSIVPGQRSQVFINAPVGMLFPGDRRAPRGVNFPDKNDWAPRVGFAWDVRGNGKTSLRGAFGVLYDILKGEDNLQFNGKPPFYASAGFVFPPYGSNPNADDLAQPFAAAGVPNPFPSRTPPQDFDFAAAGYLPIGGSSGAFVVDPHLRTPYNYQYHLTFQQEIAANTVLTASYIGSSSHGLTALQDVNPFVLGTADRVLNLAPGNSTCDSTNPSLCSFSILREFRNVANANYNSLAASVRKQLSGPGPLGHSYFTLSYTFSHNIDNASGFQNRNPQVPAYQPNLFRGSSDMDVRHRIVFSGGWELPFREAWGNGPKRLTEGWNVFPIVVWRSGFPLDVFSNLPLSTDFTSPGPSGAGDYNLVRANLVAPLRLLDPHHPVIGSGNTAVYYYFDPASFSQANFPSDAQVIANPALRTYGSLPRNFFRGPAIVNVNLAVSKSTPLSDRVRLEFRADFFNLFNHTEFLNPNTNITDTANFGQVQSTYQPRVIQLALRFSF